MKWIRGDDYHLRSDPPGFTIAKAIMGDRVAYTAFRGQEALHVERDILEADEAARRAAIDRCKAACSE